jgi:Ca2+-binding RTX toxin-like protein
MGQGGNDLLNGGDGHDTLDGGSGADQMVGGTGDDLYIVDNTSDTLIEAAGEGSDRVESSITLALIENIEHLKLVGDRWIDGYGNDADNMLTGNIGVNTLEGGAGNDHLDGYAENDTLLGGDGDDWLYGGDDYADSYDDYGGSVTTLPNDDHLDGGDGNDWLDGGSGNDVLLGGQGDDTLYGGDDGGYGDYGDHLAKNANFLTNNADHLTNNDYLDGGEGSDTLDGGSGHDILDGGTGIDRMTGGSGNDIYYVDGYTETITEPGDPNDGSGDGSDGVPGSDQPPCECDDGQPGKGNEGVGNGEDPPPPGHDHNWNDGPGTSPGNPGSQGGAKGKGNSGTHGGAHDGEQTHPGAGGHGQGNNGDTNCSDHGGHGDGTPGDGGDTPPEGDDSMVTRTVWYTDEVTEQASGGYDVVHSSATYTLTPFVEELHLTGDEALDGTGNDQDNRLYGNNAANRLDGGAGADALWGGLGDDIYVIDSEFDRIYEFADQGRDRVQSSVSYTLGEHLEDLQLLGEADLSGQGNAGDNTLTGNAGNNLLDGGAGNDTYRIGYYGGVDRLQDAEGHDTIEFSAWVTPDHVVARTTTLDGTTTAHVRLLDAHGNELADQGADIVLGGTASNLSPIESFRFADGSELTLDDLLVRTETHFGSQHRDTLTTGRNDDTVHAGAGADNIYAGGANDVLYGEAGNDSLFGEAGNDQLLGGDDDDALYGGAGNDLLQGGTGDDRLNGCLGADIHVGGAGNDELFVESGDDVVLYNDGDGRDTIRFGEYASAVTISLGGIPLEDILLGRDGDDLVIGFGEEADAAGGGHRSRGRHGQARDGDSITLANWFGQAETETTPNITLQLIGDADTTPDTDDPAHLIARFDFNAVAAAFAAGGDQPDAWTIVDAALDAHLGDSDSEALGGALAYRYAVDGSLDQLSRETISATLASRPLGREPQSIAGA